MNIVVTIVRLASSPKGTFGALLINDTGEAGNGEPFCVTLEPPFGFNRPNVASIRAGEYTARRVVSPKYGNTFEVTGVPGRSHILFHAGNVVEHTEGCILLGQYFGKLKGDRAVLNSGATFQAFLDRLAGADAFTVRFHEGEVRPGER